MPHEPWQTPERPRRDSLHVRPDRTQSAAPDGLWIVDEEGAGIFSTPSQWIDRARRSAQTPDRGENAKARGPEMPDTTALEIALRVMTATVHSQQPQPDDLDLLRGLAPVFHGHSVEGLAREVIRSFWQLHFAKFAPPWH